MRILVTRPEPDGERTALELRKRGHEVILSPLLRIVPDANAELGVGPWAGILLTSANGARAIASHTRRNELLALPLLAVGDSSADAARDAGFTDVTSAAGDGGALAALAARRFSGSKEQLLYPAGEDRARDLAGDLAASGVEVTTVVVYRTVKAETFEPPAWNALAAHHVGGVLHFSQRSAEHYLACATGLMGVALAPIHYCLSERSAAPLWRAGAADVRIAAHPDERALLELIGQA